MVDGATPISENLDPLLEPLHGPDLILHFQTRLQSLRSRVAELELENARLCSRLANCCCSKVEDEVIEVNTDKDKTSHIASGSCECSVISSNSSAEDMELAAIGDMLASGSVNGSSEDGRVKNTCQKDGNGNDLHDENPTECTKKKSKVKNSGCNLRTMDHHGKRYVALKIMYFGQRFYGFASEAQMDPTVESEIFKALQKTKLLVGDKEELRYTRCGRTDKGVSSTGQVISLFLRSRLKDTKENLIFQEASTKQTCEEEIDYVKVLNRALPKDIRVICWSPAPVDFHARFSCLSREYKYLFWKGDLDTLAMELAGKKFVGEHDFRNFCKMDALNVHNYRRKITSFEVSPCIDRSNGKDIWAVTVKGSAFIWHQVRCMVAVLFMIGRGLESPSVIDALLDTSRTPRKPQYSMASELPLILQSCEFEGLTFVCSSDAEQALREHLKNEYHTYTLQAALFQEGLASLSIPARIPSQNHKKKRVHVPLLLRPTEPSYRERRAKLNMRTNSKSSTTSSHEPSNEAS